MYRPTQAFINLSALKHNLHLVKTIAPNSKVLAVIKANGYGHGMVRVARALSSADGFCVASMDEALVLRQQGFLHRIVLLEGVFNEFELKIAYQHRLDLVIHARYQLNWLLDTPPDGQINIWIKIDTGMHRLGFALDEVEWVVDQLQACSSLIQIHLMSHFASADESDAFTQKQLTVFNGITAQYDYPKSLANSAGLQLYKTSHLEWVRPGIMLYGAGMHAHFAANLKPVMKLVSKVTALKWIAQGETVGYGNSWQAQRDTFLAIVAIGYGDGYPRHAPVGTPVLINGQKPNLVGRVSMDMITVDVTDMVNQVNIGDWVTLWGDPALTVDEIAGLCGTIGYELLCGVTQRVPVTEVYE